MRGSHGTTLHCGLYLWRPPSTTLRVDTTNSTTLAPLEISAIGTSFLARYPNTPTRDKKHMQDNASNPSFYGLFHAKAAPSDANPLSKIESFPWLCCTPGLFTDTFEYNGHVITPEIRDSAVSQFSFDGRLLDCFCGMCADLTYGQVEAISHLWWIRVSDPVARPLPVKSLASVEKIIIPMFENMHNLIRCSLGIIDLTQGQVSLWKAEGATGVRLRD